MEDLSFSTLQSERLVIRRFDPVDAEALAAYRSDEEVAIYQGWETPYSVREAEEFIGSLQDLAPGTPGNWFQFAVGLPPGAALIGDVALHTTLGDPREAELGFTFASAHQGHGYASEAVAAIIRYAFDRLSMQRLFAVTDARNVGARRLLERLGFRREGAPREDTWFKGERVSELLYARIARDV